MKIILLSFILALSNISMANSEDQKEQANICGPEHKENCTNADETSHEGAQHENAQHHNTKHGGANKDWSHKRAEQVAAIFPEHTFNKEVSTRPEKTKLISPKFNDVVTGQTVKLEWADVAKATAYHVQVSKDAGFANRSVFVLDNKMVSGTSIEVSGLEPKTKYFWRVASFNGNNLEMFTKSLFNSSSFETK